MKNFIIKIKNYFVRRKNSLVTRKNSLVEVKKAKQIHPFKIPYIKYSGRFLLLFIISIGCFEFVGLLTDKLLAFNYQFYAFNLSLISSYIMILIQYEIEYRNQIEQGYQVNYLVISKVVNVISVLTGFYSFLFLYVPKYNFSQVEYLIFVTIFLMTSIIYLIFFENRSETDKIRVKIFKRYYNLFYISSVLFLSFYLGIKIKIYSHFIIQIGYGFLILIIFLLVKLLINLISRIFIKDGIFHEVIDVYIFVFIGILLMIMPIVSYYNPKLNNSYKKIPRFSDVEPDNDFVLPKYAVDKTYDYSNSSIWIGVLEVITTDDKIFIYKGCYDCNQSSNLFMLDLLDNKFNIKLISGFDSLRADGLEIKNMFVIDNRLFVDALKNQETELCTYIIEDNTWESYLYPVRIRFITEKIYEPVKGFNDKEYYLRHGVLYDFTEDEGYQVLIDSYIEWIKFENDYVLFQKGGIIYKYSTSFEEIAKLEVKESEYDSYQIYPFDNEIVVLLNENILFYDMDFNLLENQESYHNVGYNGQVIKNNEYYIINNTDEFYVYDKNYKLVNQGIDENRFFESQYIGSIHIFEKDGTLYGVGSRKTYKFKEIEISEHNIYTESIYNSSLESAVGWMMLLLIFPFNVLKKSSKN